MIFVGIVTCNREDFFKKCYESFKKCNGIDFVAVVNDGKSDVIVDEKDIYIKNKVNMGVGKSKNTLFREAFKLKKQGEDIQHIFIIEDDIIAKDLDVFLKYIAFIVKCLAYIHSFIHFQYSLFTQILFIFEKTSRRS